MCVSVWCLIRKGLCIDTLHSFYFSYVVSVLENIKIYTQLGESNLTHTQETHQPFKYTRVLKALVQTYFHSHDTFQCFFYY